MLVINAKIRKRPEVGKIPAIIYGHKIKNLALEVDEKEFSKIFKQTGESSLVSLKIEGEKQERPVLIHEIQRDPVKDKIIHIDFYQASLKEEAEVTVQLTFEGVAAAVKDLGGTLVKNITEVKVKALPQNLPHEIKVNIDGLKTFEDRILIKDLPIPPDVKILKDPQEIVLSVAAPAKVEEELEKPIEEKVEEVEKVEKEKKEEEIVEEKKEEKEA